VSNIGVTTLGAMRASAADRADMPTPTTTTFVTTANWNAYINASCAELWGLLVQKYGNDYVIKLPPSTVTADGVNDYFSLPTDFFKLSTIQAQLFNAPYGYVTLQSFMLSEMAQFSYPFAMPFAGQQIPRYRVVSSQTVGAADQVWFSPRPTSGQVFRVFYVPRFTDLVSDSDTFDGFGGHWEEYVIIDAAIKALQKEESDVSVLLAQKGAIIERIEAEAANRDTANPQRVPDMGANGSYGWWGNDGSNGGMW
jgi:hypothetical protein